MKPYLSVIIPAYNEAKRLPLTLVDIDRHLRGVKYFYEIIVVNNNSTDATAEVVERFSHIIKNLKLLNCKVPGKGATVKRGLLEAKGEIRLFTDADNSTSVDQFSKMIPYLKEGYDIIIGSRDIKGAKLVPPQPWHKRLAGDIGNLIIQILLLPGMWDTQCGFKAFSEKAALKIFPLMKISRWAFDVEALVLAKKLGYRIKEIPVVWVNDPFSAVKASSYIHFFWEVIKIKWWIISNKYEIRSTKS